MARRSSRQVRRDTTAIANVRHSTLHDVNWNWTRSDILDDILSDALRIEDRRNYAPVDDLRYLSGAKARLAAPMPRVEQKKFRRSVQMVPRAQLLFPEPTVAFARPNKLSLCIRRKQRKEIIHAMGRGGTKVRKPKRRQNSNISCRG